MLESRRYLVASSTDPSIAWQKAFRIEVLQSKEQLQNCLISSLVNNDEIETDQHILE